MLGCDWPAAQPSGRDPIPVCTSIHWTCLSEEHHVLLGLLRFWGPKVGSARAPPAPVPWLELDVSATPLGPPGASPEPCWSWSPLTGGGWLWCRLRAAARACGKGLLRWHVEGVSAESLGGGILLPQVTGQPHWGLASGPMAGSSPRPGLLSWLHLLLPWCGRGGLEHPDAVSGAGNSPGKLASLLGGDSSAFGCQKRRMGGRLPGCPLASVKHG